MGKIINAEDSEKVSKSKPKSVVPDWQDPQLLEEIKVFNYNNLKTN